MSYSLGEIFPDPCSIEGIANYKYHLLETDAQDQKTGILTGRNKFPSEYLAQQEQLEVMKLCRRCGNRTVCDTSAYTNLETREGYIPQILQKRSV